MIMRHPGVHDASQVVLGESDHKIQAFSSQRADEPFAKCVRLRTVRWRFQDPVVLKNTADSISLQNLRLGGDWAEL